MTPSFWHGLRRRLEPTAVRLTLGVWIFGLAAFSLSVAVATAGRIEPRTAIWLGAITATGLMFSVGLYELVRRGLVRDRRGWIVLGLAVGVLAVAQAALDGAILEFVHRLFDLPPGPWFVASNFAYNSVTYLWIFGFYAAALELISKSEQAAASMKQSAEYAVQAAKARELAREAQVQVLRLQLNPHFLFNTLNGISALIVSNKPAQAEAMIMRLSRFLRVTLMSAQDDLVPLAAELAAAEAYLDIETARFSAAPDVHIDCPPALSDALVPSLILQPLIENALNPALDPTGGAGRLRVAVRAESEALILTVSDDASRSEPATSEPEFCSGLDIVRRRLAVVYGEAGVLDIRHADGVFDARVRIPLRRHEPRSTP